VTDAGGRTNTVPVPARPRFPRGYGIEKATPEPGERLPWARVIEWLVAARSYWVDTTRPDGRPHAKPVWGLWRREGFLFATHPQSVTARNLADNPRVVVHLESAERVAILEGHADPVADRTEIEDFSAAYEAKYGVRVDPAHPGELHAVAVYRVRPTLALTWTEADFPESSTRWTFER
jgi:hypothetical protein